MNKILCIPVTRVHASWEIGDRIKSLQATSVHESNTSRSTQNKRTFSQFASIHHLWTASYAAIGPTSQSQITYNTEVCDFNFFFLVCVTISKLVYFTLCIFYCLCIFSSSIANSSCTSMYEKTFPIKVMQSPTHSTSSGRLHTSRHHCTAQEVRYWNKGAVFLLNQFLFFLNLSISIVFAVCLWRGERGLQAAPGCGLWWPVIFPSQWQLTRHHEVTQRFVRIKINSRTKELFMKVVLKCITNFSQDWLIMPHNATLSLIRFIYDLNFDNMMFTLHHINKAVIDYSSAPAFWPPAVDCCRSPLLVQQQEKHLRHPAAPPAQGACQVRAPATSPVHCQPTPRQGDRRGPWTLTSVPPGHLHLPQLPLLLLCTITPPRTHNHHVNILIQESCYVYFFFYLNFKSVLLQLTMVTL